MNDQIEKLLRDRYYLEDENSWDQIASRVSVFYPPIKEHIEKLEFIPSTPTLINGNTGKERLGTLSSCFPMGIEDSIEGIYGALEECAITTKYGGGVGYDFSCLRSSQENIQSINRDSSGPLPFINVFNATLDGIQQGGVRRGAGMALLSIEHPDILNFINAKSNLNKFSRFNFSISIPNSFYITLDKKPDSIHMVKDRKGQYYELVDSEGNKITVQELWNLIVHKAWKYAEPGIFNYDIALRECTVTNIDNRVLPNPCLRDSVKVLSKKGIITLQELNIGDEIWSQEGWTKVINKFPTGNKEVFKYHTTAGIFESTDNHEIMSNCVKVEVKDSDSIDTLQGEYIEKNKFLPELIMDGLVLGDGSKHKASNNLIYLIIGEKDNDYFNSEIKDLLLKDRTVGLGGWEIKTSITPEELDSTYNRKLPERFFKLSNDEKYSVLRGLYTANGSLCGNRVTYKTASLQMILDIQLLLSSLGLKSYYTINKSKKVKFHNGEYQCKQSYDLNITTDIDKFFESIGFIQKYKNIKLKEYVEERNNKKRNRKGKITYDIVKQESIGFHDVWDITVDNNSHTFWCEGFNISNCSEFCNIPYSSCNLGSINLSKFVNDKGIFQYSSFVELIKKSTRFLDSIIDNNIFPLKKIEEVTKAIRPIGLGEMGLAHALYLMKIPYNSEEALSFASKVTHMLTMESMKESIELAKERGSYPAFDFDIFINSNKKFFSKKENKYLIDDIKIHGIRNSCFTSIAPTGSISTIAETSSGIEPIFALTYHRRVEKLNKEYDIMYITDPIFENYLSITFDEDKKRKILEEVTNYKGSCQGCNDIPEDIRKIFLVAGDLTADEHLVMLESVAANTSLSVSKTINLPSSAKEEDVSRVYLGAYKKNIKGVTVYRDGCREGILVHSSDNNQILEHNAPKRPDSLPCHVYKITVHGEKWIVFVGLLNGKPYEVFAGKISLVDIPSNITEGTLTKVKRCEYQFEHDGEVLIKDISKLFETGAQESITRLISTALRHGAPIEFINEQLSKSHGTVVDFNKSILRAFKRYIKKSDSSEKCSSCGENLIYTDGCKQCPSCGIGYCG